MAIDLSAFAPVPFSPGDGARPSSMPIALCVPFDKQIGPRTLRVSIPWTSPPYNASFNNRTVVVQVELASQSVMGGGSPLDQIRFCKIDNTFNDVTVYAQFTDTGDVVQCPPNSIVGVQVMSKNQKVLLYGTDFFTGRTPVTNFYFSNVPQEPFIINDAGRVRGTCALSNLSLNTANQLAYNFPTNRIGTAFSTRTVAVVALSCRAALGPNPITSMSINGQPVASLFQRETGAINGLALGIGALVIPAGTSSSIDVVYPNQQDFCAVASYVMSGISSPIPFDTNSGSGINAGWENRPTVALNDIPGSVSIYGMIDTAIVSLANNPLLGEGGILDYYRSTTAAPNYTFALAHIENDNDFSASLNLNLALEIGATFV